MTITLDRERLLTFAELAALLPRRRQGRPVHPSTIHRWRSQGLRGVRLEAVRIGGAWHTTWPAFTRFCAALTQLGSAGVDAPTCTDQQIAHDIAQQRLTDAGW